MDTYRNKKKAEDIAVGDIVIFRGYKQRYVSVVISIVKTRTCHCAGCLKREENEFDFCALQAIDDNETKIDRWKSTRGHFLEVL